MFISFAFIFGLLLPGMAIGADDFGTLFTTPAERANLDYLRKTTKLPDIVPDQPVEAGAVSVPAVSSPVSVEGYVKRNDGKQGTVWVNQAPIQENSDSGGVSVGKMQRGSNQVPIKLSNTGKSLNLKAGQVYDPETGTVSEVSAHAKKMAKDADSGTIGENPTESPDD